MSQAQKAVKGQRTEALPFSLNFNESLVLSSGACFLGSPTPTPCFLGLCAPPPCQLAHLFLSLLQATHPLPSVPGFPAEGFHPRRSEICIAPPLPKPLVQPLPGAADDW